MWIRNALIITALFGLAIGCGDDDRSGMDPGSEDASTGTSDGGTPPGSEVDGGSDPRCGDGTVDADEACDDGNDQNGDGCENDCSFSCEAPADCDDGNACNGIETCDEDSHRCEEGEAPAAGTPCEGGFCRASMCAPASCGNGSVDGDEDCDDGNEENGDGCENDCSFSCEAPADCDDGNVCNGAETCEEHVCVAGTPADDGTTCGDDLVCRESACAAVTCGDGMVEGDEDCDDGNEIEGDGCENDCSFSCEAPADCDDGNVCNGAEACEEHVCVEGSPADDGTECGEAMVCREGTCEMAGPTCGNGVVEGDEVCDDGNTEGGDECSADCSFAIPVCQPYCMRSDAAGEATLTPSLDTLVEDAAAATCGALFRCCDDDVDRENYFAEIRRDGSETWELAEFRPRLPPEAADFDEEACVAVMTEIFAFRPFGPWLAQVEAGRVAFDAEAYATCLETLQTAECGAEVADALADGSCLGFESPFDERRRMFRPLGGTGDECVPLPDGRDHVIHGTCASDQHCCVPREGAEGCFLGNPRDAAAVGTCTPTAARGEACSVSLVDYAPCDLEDECASSTCVAPTEVGIGETCAEGFSLIADCGEGYCDFPFGSDQCIPQKEVGETCSTPQQCVLGVCAAN